MKKGKHHSKKRFPRILLIIFIILIILIVIFLSIPNLNNLSTPNKSSNSNIIEENSISAMLANIPETSAYAIKNFPGAEYLNVSNLGLKYENNITAVRFNINNNSSDDQDVFYFTLTLTDIDGNVLINFDISSEEIIESNNSKEFIVVAAKDVSSATDYQLSIQK